MQDGVPWVFRQGPWRLSMGLHALDPAAWIEIDAGYAAEIAEREALLAERSEQVHAMLPEGEAGAAETLAMLIEHLPARFPERFSRPAPGSCRRADGAVIDTADRPPLAAAARLVQEDLCVLAPAEDGYRLVAAALCFPAHWRLHEKLGRSMRTIHTPVPGFTDTLAGPADRFFKALVAERPVWRANWSINEDDRRFHPVRGAYAEDLGPDNAGSRLWLRVERQTLRRLPRSGAVLFTIRTHLARIDEVAAVPGAAVDLAARIREMPPEMVDYKGLAAIREPLLAWLDRHGLP